MLTSSGWYCSLSTFCHGIFQIQVIYFNDDTYQGQSPHTVYIVCIWFPDTNPTNKYTQWQWVNWQCKQSLWSMVGLLKIYHTDFHGRLFFKITSYIFMVYFLVGGGVLLFVFILPKIFSGQFFFLFFEVGVEGKAQLQKRLVLKSNVLWFQCVLVFVKAVKWELNFNTSHN